jgi:hypothetical protein
VIPIDVAMAAPAMDLCAKLVEEHKSWCRNGVDLVAGEVNARESGGANVTGEVSAKRRECEPKNLRHHRR